MISLETIVVGSFEVNCYLYRLENSKDTVIIDPGADYDRICNVVESKMLNPVAVMLTHGHIDHIAAVGDVMEKYQIPLFAGKGEEQLLSDSTANLSAMWGQPITTPKPKKLLEDSEYISLAGIDFKVLATPGHSPGGVCYLDEKHNVLFTGDTLFYGSIGRTDFPGCSTEQLLDSIKRSILTLPDSIDCYPGHGPATTVGGERINNPFLQGGFFA